MSRSDRASEGRSGSAANVAGPCHSFVAAAARAVHGPFEVAAQGEGGLAAPLRALDLDRIRDIAEAYELVPPKPGAPATRAELIVEILATVSSARREPAER